LLEQRSQNAEIDLFYGDETQVSEEGYVPYGWQFKGEQVSIACAKGARINCFGLLTRHNQFVHATTAQTITADFVIEQIDSLSFEINKHTVIVLDNARVHSCKKDESDAKGMGKAQSVYFLFAALLPTSEYNRAAMERNEDKVDMRRRL